jgi:ABC-2 type transport system permease protein
MPPAAYLIAKMLMAMLFAIVVMATMESAALTLGHLPLNARQIFSVALVNIFGVLPFCAIGLFIGTLVKGTAAPGFTHLIYLPMMYLSGLFFPLPHSLMAIAPIWPAYHLNQLVLTAAGVPASGSAIVHFAVLLAVAFLFTLLSLNRLRRAG